MLSETRARDHLVAKRQQEKRGGSHRWLQAVTSTNYTEVSGAGRIKGPCSTGVCSSSECQREQERGTRSVTLLPAPRDPQLRLLQSEVSVGFSSVRWILLPFFFFFRSTSHFQDNFQPKALSTLP